MAEKWTMKLVQERLAAGKIRGFIETLKNGQKKRNKYGNNKISADGKTFDSTKEYRRWCALKLRLKAGEIGLLEHQVTYRLEIQGELICKYIADFKYFDRAKDAFVVEDVKSSATRKIPAYRLKKKLMRELLGIEIQEV